MKHNISVTNAHPRTRLRRDGIVDVVARVLRGEKVGRASVSVVLVSDDHLLELNREHLAHDYYTDVITFPLEEDPLEGEIYISVDRAREQAREHRVGTYEEVRRLAAHGALHLAGHDDTHPEERERMRILEDHYLSGKKV